MPSTTPAATPRSTIVTVFGAFVRRIGGWIAVADLVLLLDDLGIDEPSARSAVTRLKRTGLLESRTHRSSPGYAAGAELAEILRAGDTRIFQSRIGADLADGWVLVISSVPEAQRDRRHLLRTRLAALGCGSVGSGVVMAPRRVAADIRRMLARLDLARYALVFEGRYDDVDDLTELVASTWDTATMHRHYTAFSRRHGKTMARWSEHDHGSRGAFADYIAVVHDWRRLAYEDPGLPDAVTPYVVQRNAAVDLFSAATARLGPAALTHVEATVGDRRVDR